MCMLTFSSICDFTLLSGEGKLLKKTKPTTVFVQASVNPTHQAEVDVFLHQNFHIRPFLKLVLKSPVPVMADSSPYRQVAVSGDIERAVDLCISSVSPSSPSTWMKAGPS